MQPLGKGKTPKISLSQCLQEWALLGSHLLPFSSPEQWLHSNETVQKNKTPESTSNQTSVWEAEQAKGREKNPFKLWKVCLYSCIKINLTPDTRTWMDLPSKGVLKFIARPTKSQRSKEALKGTKPFLYSPDLRILETLGPKDFCKTVSNVNQLKGAHYKFPKPDQITAKKWSSQSASDEQCNPAQSLPAKIEQKGKGRTPEDHFFIYPKLSREFLPDVTSLPEVVKEVWMKREEDILEASHRILFTRHDDWSHVTAAARKSPVPQVGKLHSAKSRRIMF